jgi:hypothetical protein
MRVLQWNIFSTFALLGDFDCLRMTKEWIRNGVKPPLRIHIEEMVLLSLA